MQLRTTRSFVVVEETRTSGRAQEAGDAIFIALTFRRCTGSDPVPCARNHFAAASVARVLRNRVFYIV